VEDLSQHEMHEEYIEIPGSSWQSIQEARDRQSKIWSLGTTVARSLESAASGLLDRSPEGGYWGMSRLLISPGFSWQVTDRLLTNFHQPQSTLLALVAAFAGLEKVHRCYRWAIEKEFRLFSYGDLGLWEKS
jgi:S-adenosylmethionine:tRNA ribosyltransferase-isomerase